MNDIKLYEKIPVDEFPIRLLEFEKDSFVFPLHWHEHTEIHFIFNGTAEIRCGDKIMKLKANDCVIVNGNELHEGLGGSCDRGCIILPPSFFENNRVTFNIMICDKIITELVTKIFSEFREQDSVTSLSLKGYTYLLVSYLLRHYSTKVFTEPSYRQHFEKLNKVNNVIKYINENYVDNITTSELADIVHISEGHFCHIFKEITGKTAKEYLNSIRIKKAAALLSETSMTVTEVAYCCGFSDSNYFARIFKKYTGHTPSAVRHLN